MSCVNRIAVTRGGDGRLKSAWEIAEARAEIARNAHHEESRLRLSEAGKMAERKPATRREIERQSMYMRGVRARATLHGLLNKNWKVPGYLNRKRRERTRIFGYISGEHLNFMIL